ncbi:inositol monophosphatase family protein [Pseudooceanicola sp. LIPI14-2-Ac024]|uniref:inositol monophosphatase family protein n=1 Tax=Pseudooceanicola sp. LIPI14-2-Ac024 TaxID=3344875 RepID=UPI0035CEF690
MSQPADRALHDRLVARLPVLVGEVMSGAFATEAKGDDGLDFVTSVDLALQRALEDELAALLPGSVVTGEEGYTAARGDAPVWLVDPLDGTVNFVAGLPSYAVAVALTIDGRTVLSAVHDIRHETTYSALSRQGAFVKGAPLARRDHPAKLATLSSGLMKDLATHAPAALAAMLNSFKLRNVGSQALHLCYAAAGHLSLVASREAKGWDDMAGALIAQEAGLRYGHYHGGDTPPVDRDQFSLCAEPALFEEYASVLAGSLGPVIAN